ncbi:MAG: hypothetical protein K0S74_1035 [Chlamydiales bacterium]|jgi:cell division protein FtsI/penicillin-binding protein 2|nr:hypothetical protein [Chlamydiales bacterium]
MVQRKKISKRLRETVSSIPVKATTVLHFILFALLFIFLRVWYLAVIQYDEKLEESRKPQQKVVVQRAERGTIRDRFNEPLAINQVQYNIGIAYSAIKEIRSIAWKRELDGKKTKLYPRNEYIKRLANMLADEIDMEAQSIEDIIHSKAAVMLPNTLCIIKEDIMESAYLRLKAIEKDWPGLCAELVPHRYYPQGKVAADIIGYVGAISQQEYASIKQEIQQLKDYINSIDHSEEPTPINGIDSLEQAQNRLQELEDKAYRLNDQVGKMGIEAAFDEQLRGYYGKAIYELDSKGNILSQAPESTTPIPGQRVLLSISSELQACAEQLLAENERIRDGKSRQIDSKTKSYEILKQPWIKGGAIIVMDPHTGDILTMASYPRFNPNDFITSGNLDKKREHHDHIVRWLEKEEYLSDIWDGKKDLERELYSRGLNSFYDEGVPMQWDNYLNFILPTTGLLKATMQKINTVESAVMLQQSFHYLMQQAQVHSAIELMDLLYGQKGGNAPASLHEKLHEFKLLALKKSHSFNQHRNVLDRFLSPLLSTYEKILVLDLCQVAVADYLFEPNLLNVVGKVSLLQYRKASSAITIVMQELKHIVRENFHKNLFARWRIENEKTFLEQKRAEEKAKKLYAKPYAEYLDKQEHLLFDAYWEKHRWDLLSILLTGQDPDHKNIDKELVQILIEWHQLVEDNFNPLTWQNHYLSIKKLISELGIDKGLKYLQTMRGYRDLNRPLLGNYPQLRRQGSVQLEKHLAGAFYPVYGFGTTRSYTFRQATTQGSIFKLVTAYITLLQRYNRFLVEGHRPSFTDLNPLVIIDQKHRPLGNATGWNVGYTIDGKPIPQIYKGGRLLVSSQSNIGKIDLLRAIETSSNPYFSLLAGDMLNSPEDLNYAASLFSYGRRTGIDLPGEYGGQLPKDLLYNRSGLYSYANGQHAFISTPLQTAVALSAIANNGHILKPKIVHTIAGQQPIRNRAQPEGEQENPPVVRQIPREIKQTIPMPKEVRLMLLEGMHRVIHGPKGGARPSIISSFHDNPRMIEDYISIKDSFIGKTGTAEIIESVDLERGKKPHIYNHIWFGGIAFDPESPKTKDEPYGQPELVVVVYLRFGDYGREAAPLAAQMVKKWREIKKKYSKTS